MAGEDGHQDVDNRRGWRRLGMFWVAVLALLGAGGGVLQWLGPPENAARREANTVHGTVVSHGAARPIDDLGAIILARPGLVAPVVAGRDTPGPIADPDPALLEPSRAGATENLPRIAADGRVAMKVYAAGYDHSSRRPRVGLLLAGIGLNEAESDAAIRALPGAVSLGVSPYAVNLTKLLATARTSGHEYLIAIPLEPSGFPLNDPGPHALLTSASAAVNQQNLHWALSRVDGFVGATGVIGTMRGERLAAMTDQMDTMLSELSGRGLLYVDPLEEHGPVARAWGRHVDLVVDDPADRDVADRTMIDAQLAALEQVAKDTGSALGLVMRPTPVAVARIAAWSNGLTDRGLALAPVSALAMPPADGLVKVTEREP
jgi:polysaccharide deacetylase 2 family uncharacterized protein YibQ